MESHHLSDETFSHHAHHAAHQVDMYQQQQHEVHLQQQTSQQQQQMMQQKSNHNQRNSFTINHHSQPQLHVSRAQQMSHNHISTNSTNHHSHRYAINTNQHHQTIRQNRTVLSTQNRTSGNSSPFQQQRYQNNHAPQMHHQIIPTAGLNQNHNQHVAGGFMRQGIQDSDFPLRILVQSGMVGAIIGRSGSTIKQITQQSKARIDVHREESLDQQEKVITINGTPESCSAACFKIIEIILNEKLQVNKIGSSNNLDNQTIAKHSSMDSLKIGAIDLSSEIQLRILAHNNLIGRLIGRNGVSIKKIMEQTSTKINISLNSLTDCTNERTITVVGNLGQVRQAEQVISTKLRAAYMSDISNTLQAINQQPYLFNNVPISYIQGSYAQNPILSSLVNSQAGHGGHGMSRGMPLGPHQNQITGPPFYPNSSSYLSLYPNINVQSSGHGLLGFNPAMTGLEVEKETVNIYIPNSLVGAIIGKSGSAIKEMINNSGASIKIAAATTLPTNTSKEESSTLQQQNKSDSIDDSNSEDIRSNSTHDSQTPVVTCPQSIPRQPGSSECYPSTRKVTIIGTPESQWSAQYLIYRKVLIENGKSDISLMVEIQVPSQLVGKIIGKGGVTVKHIQKQTRTTIRLPDEKPSLSDTENDLETPVQITGEFQCSQLAQRHIRNLIKESLYLSSRQNKSHQSKSNAQANFIDNHQSDENSAHNESPHTGDTERPHKDKSQNLLTENGEKVDEHIIMSNNNTMNKNLNSTGESANKMGDHSDNDQNDDHENDEKVINSTASCAKRKSRNEPALINNGNSN